jgi:phosphate uptake regulator
MSSERPVSVSALEDLGQDLAMMARLVQSQLITAMTAFFQRDTTLAHRVTERDDQIDNLLSFIEEKCFQRIAGEGSDTPRSRRLRGVFRIALNLEKLGDFAVNIAEQAEHVARFGLRLVPFDLAQPARTALAALDEVITSFTDASAEKAKHACLCEPELDRQYREALAETFRRLSGKDQEPAFIITNLFVAKFLERIGDSILNIGETTLFILTGERLKLHQYLHLEHIVGRVAPTTGKREALDFRQIWGGISGARLGRLSLGPAGPLIWKEGAERKIEEEIHEMEEWNRLVPGLVPEVKARYQDNGRTSFLGQFVDGTLLRDVYITRSWDEKERATHRLLETVRDVWLATARTEPSAVDYVRQIRERLPELYAMHPQLEAFRRAETRVFGITHPSLAELLERTEAIQAHLGPPLSVRIHGDFNANNIFYSAAADRIHFVDVHRSGPGDYLQDVGVLLVSNLRNPIQDRRIRWDLERINRLVEEFAAEFARLIEDEHFEARLVLSQARSFITSSRLVSDPEFARRMYLKGVRWLERALAVCA